MHPEIDKIVEGLVARKKYIYLCTNALLFKEKLAPLQAKQVSNVLGPRGWAARTSRLLRVSRGRLRSGN